MPDNAPDAAPRDLTRFALLSIAAALVTIALKTGAWWMTGSVGLLSDAAESLVNLVAAIVAYYALKVAAQPPDETHLYGHSKAEYLSALVEGVMIFVAAVVILYTSVERFLNPQPLENVGVGLGISVAASVVNGAVAFVLLRAGREHRSLTLVADGQHLMTDVWTSAGVVVGVLIVALTGIDRLDPVVAFLVGVNIVVTGVTLVRESVRGFMDHAWSDEEHAELMSVFDRFTGENVSVHGLRTRVAGHHRFAEMHLLVPGSWTVAEAHDLEERIEVAVREELGSVSLMCHVEPIEDPRSYDDFAAQARLPEGNGN